MEVAKTELSAIEQVIGEIEVAAAQQLTELQLVTMCSGTGDISLG